LPAPPRLSATPYGERAILVRVPGSPTDVARAAAAVAALDATLDVGAGRDALLVVAPAPLDPLRRADLQGGIARALAAARAAPPPQPRRHVIEVVYDGPDLASLADAASVAASDVARLHAARELEVEVVGFLPGFAYLAEIDPRLQRPRRASPRARVPAGSVGVAGRYTGIYPTASPGGWHIVGRARDAALFDPSRDPPARLAVGDRVRFEAVDAGPTPAPEAVDASSTRSADAAARAVAITKVSALASVQDGGRARWLRRGVPASGAVDPVALAAANLAVGNDAAAAGLEIAGGGIRLVARGDVLASIDGEPGVLLRDGASLDVAPAARLCRYVALRGGVAVPEVLGARATAVSAALGGYAGRVLRAGDVLPVGDDPGTRVPERSLLPVPGSASPLVLRLDPLPPRPPLGAGTLDALLAAAFTVSRAVDRTGVRLEGPALPRDAAGDAAAPEPVLPGAIQITSDGLPIVLGPDAAVTGGYPVVGVVRKTSLWSLYRLRPGATVRFARG
jgi:KipI family sensor histidine kinase inhibitor